jgi:RTX calcium-binding nonapeptide repeat (4 copies)
VRPAIAATVALLALAPSAANAATASVEGGTLRILAAPDEYNAFEVSPGATGLLVSDTGAPLTLGAGCVRQGIEALCTGAARVEAELGDGDDVLTLSAPLPADIEGGDGFDTLSGGEADDRIDGGTGGDSAYGGGGDDSIVLRDAVEDTAACGAGRDTVRAEVRDQLDFACERVDYGPAGSVGRLRPITGGGRFVPIPGQSWARVDRRILPDVLYLIRRYHVRVGDGYAFSGHERLGEHPLGLAVDLYPGPGGSWRQVGRLAKWAEPRQNHTRPPWRWVGWNGDSNHGDPNHCKVRRGCAPHLHLSWSHSPGKPGRPVRRVWVFDVRAAR